MTWSPPSLSAAVMAHPKRAEMVEDLLGRLDRPVPVVWDRIGDRHDTGARALSAFDASCSHHLVIQDDSLPVVDLLAGAERALLNVPRDVPVSLYTGKARPFGPEITRAIRRARAADASWLTMQGVYWGPAIVVPTAHLPALIEWFVDSKVTNYDRRISTWYSLRGAKCWYTRPSLVDHRGMESLCGHGRAGAVRTAHSFPGTGVSALSIDWSGPVVDLPYSERMDHAREARAKALL